ncbi:DUF1289 domain-containing protein [Vibrio sp. qd031]|uniref:DUF1289 domain-containing protein n=1 Tax=Vibrio sp. qd031 TaxID=1603038 RepID=UPI000A11DF31|nr:DUF1289 domain-containing protein [Vibrio sp. qd031]
MDSEIECCSVESPCVRNCCLDEHDICVGCFRSIDEIVAWSGASDQEKITVLHHCHARKQVRKQARENKPS